MTFGGSSISEELYKFIVDRQPVGGTILEFGSGEGSTGELSKRYTMYSVEHDANYVGKYNSNYIHAPLVNGWYDLAALQRGLPKDYDAVLIDGPVGEGNRIPIIRYLDLFDFDNKWVVVDDTHRTGEIVLFHFLMQKFKLTDVYVGEDFSAFMGTKK